MLCSRRILTFLALLLANAIEMQSQEQLMKNQNDDLDQKAAKNTSILFRTSQPMCRMYAASCDMSVLIRKRIEMPTLEFVSTDNEIFEVRHVEVCNDTRLCSYDQFNVNETVFNENKYIYYRIEIQPGLIGRANISIRQRNSLQVVASYGYVIVQPRRVVDIIFDVWIYVLGTVISLLMGVLLDRASLVKIIKMPKPIAIGFCCQYLMMPLVCSFKFAFKF
jgi:hypothetical protein